MRLCRPDRAKTKGRIERFNRYLRGSLSTRRNVEVLKWLRDVADVREHQSTGEPPVDRLEADQRAMLPYEPAMAPIEASARDVPGDDLDGLPLARDQFNRPGP